MIKDAFGVPGAGLDLASEMKVRAAKILVRAKTLVGGMVDVSRDSALTDADPMMICIFTPKISRTWTGGVSPTTFDGKLPLVIAGKVTADTKDEADFRLNMLRVQIENALFGAVEFWDDPIEKVNSVETSQELPGDAEKHEGYVTMVIECTCTDVFKVRPCGVPLSQIQLTVPNLTMPADNETPANNLIGALAEIPQ